MSTPVGGASRRGTIGRAGWAIGDQALSSLTNFGLAIVVAHQTSIEAFGAFSLALAVYTIALSVSRAAASEPLAIRYATTPVDEWRSATAAAAGSALVFGVGGGVAVVALGLLIGGDAGNVLIALGVALPALLVQDAWRFAFFAVGRGRSAFVNDLVWTVVLVVAFALVLSRGVTAVPMLILAWAAGAFAGAIVGTAQARVLPRPSQAPGWWREHRAIAPRFAAEALIVSAAQPLTLLVIGAIAGLAVVGTIRAGQVLMNALHIASFGVLLFGVPEGARLLTRSTGHLLRLCLVVASGLMLLALAWGTFLLVLPDDIGQALMGANWEAATSVLIPATVMAMAAGAQSGAHIGLRALAAARRSLSARIVSSTMVSLGGLLGAAIGGAVTGSWGMAVGMSFGASYWWWQSMAATRDHERTSANVAVASTERSTRSGQRGNG